jgi:hypothetical protein
MSEIAPDKPTRGFWIVSVLALVWNLVGVMSYLMTVTIGQEALAGMPEAERALYTNVPVWATSAYAIAVFAGLLGSIGLLLRKTWAMLAFVVSLAAILVQMGHAFLMTPLLAVKGPGAAILPLTIIVIGGYLVWFSRSARDRFWLR